MSEERPPKDDFIPQAIEIERIYREFLGQLQEALPDGRVTGGKIRISSRTVRPRERGGKGRGDVDAV